ncbi:solute carrier family 53 member 1 [Anabrus simplex]|uniref:solute carrier family 53 member 1 n=1 Tax=Anabrus simplex TaxID=316456 RepID=UPI0035A344B8
MKFAEHLAAHITPEWRKQYISYEEMKAMLYTAVEEAPSAESVEPEVLTRHFANFDDHFFQFCDNELKKINTFYSEKLAEATRKFAALQNELQSTRHMEVKSNKSRLVGKPPTTVRKIQDLKLAFSEFYLSLILLQNYQNLNYTGFRKILKKHDKLLSVDVGAKWREEHVETSLIYTNKDIDRLINETEMLVTQELEGGDRQKAMKRLRVPPLGEQQSPWITFKVGLFSGSFIVLFLVVVLSAIFHEGAEEDNLRIAFRLFRGPLLLIEFLFLMGVNVYGWRSSGVNHVLIFELDPRNHLSEQHLMELAAIFGVIWTLSLLSFLYSSSLSIPPYINPLALTGIMLVFLFNPVHTFRYEARFWSLRVLGRILAAPFFHVGFADFWLADQLNSLVTACLDYHFLICFYINNGNWLTIRTDVGECTDDSLLSRSIVNCLPAWFRFAQCLRRYRDSREAFPHLVNAGKYSTTFLVVIFAALRSLYKDNYETIFDNPYFYMWVLASVVSSIYAYTWDIKMDWGLFDKSAGENKFLREETVYSSTTFYYFAIVEDFVLRFAWIASFIITESKLATSDLVTSILAPLEVFRRFVWNFFRLENEHLNNCGKFRAVRDISVAPIDSSDQAQILRMMDDEDGVINRHKKKADKKKEDTKMLISEPSEPTPASFLEVP